MNKLLLATTNPGKLAEYKKYLSDLPIKLLSLQNLKITQSITESGKTFAENALLKAEYYCKLSGLPTLADDGGFEIDALDGEPGVKSNRWIDPSRKADDQEIITYTLKRMKTVPDYQRGAQLRLVLVLVTPDKKKYVFTEKIRGIVAKQPSLYPIHGLPYRSLLYLPDLHKYYDELTDEENQKYNHRRKAVERMKPIILKQLTRQ